MRALVLSGLALTFSGCCGELDARRYDEELDCLEEVEQVGCPAEVDCGAKPTVAESEYGSLWLFPDACVPENFTVVEGRFVEEIVDAPLCSSL